MAGIERERLWPRDWACPGEKLQQNRGREGSEKGRQRVKKERAKRIKRKHRHSSRDIGRNE